MTSENITVVLWSSDTGGQSSASPASLPLHTVSLLDYVLTKKTK